MTLPEQLTRRRFLAAAGITALATQMRIPSLSREARFAFVAMNSVSGAIHVYAANRGLWELRQLLPAESPAALALHPNGRVLYVLHDVEEYSYLPRGYIDAYQIEVTSGCLSLISRQPLSLSATSPRHFAIAPGGRCLAVSAYGGGILNLLHVHADGCLGRVFAIRKETSCIPIVPHPSTAHPEAVVFDSSGRYIFLADSGSDTVSIFSAGPSLQLLARCILPSGSGPRYLALDPANRFLYVSCALSGLLVCLRYQTHPHRLEQISAYVCEGLDRSFAGPLVVDADRSILHASGKVVVTSFRMDRETGRLSLLKQQKCSDIDEEAVSRDLFVTNHNDVPFVLI